MSRIALTGIKPTGTIHLGNWLGAIRPALELAQNFSTYYFIADYHALTTVRDAKEMIRNTHEIAAAYLAFGLDPEKSVFYRQSDVPEIFELSWLLGCFTPKGFMNRAHAYKDSVAKNQEKKQDPDHNINMGLYSYPVLMSADILMFNADVVPVGHDQKQHVEFARDIAERFNATFGDTFFNLPEPKIRNEVMTIPGLDGRKMSKSYNNVIPLFADPKPLRKTINKIVTNSQDPEEPKDPEQSNVYHLHSLLLSEEDAAGLAQRYRAGGMGWGQAKKELFETLDGYLQKPREEFNRLMSDTSYIDEILKKGAERARQAATPFMSRLRKAVGIR